MAQQSAPQMRKPAQINHQPLHGIEKVVAIASGKGGVGKSTTTIMLAHALASQGQNASILDADIYGPSVPKMLGLKGKPDTEDGLMIPLENHGIACHSMGFLMEEDQAAIWRGPMVTKAINQLSRGTQWPSSKLLVDFPPGTGDVQLSMAQQVPLSGAILVVTPQEMALADARRCAVMFQKLSIPILGIIENMSWFDAEDGKRYLLFDEGGGERLAQELGIPLLAQIPQMPELMTAMETGDRPSEALISRYYDVLKVL